MLPPDEAQLYVGKVLGGRFEVRDFINQGGFCFVFEGTDHQTKHRVAVKILRQGVGADGIIEFENEGQLLKLLERASNVVTLIDAGTDSVQVSTVPAGAVISLPVRYLVLELADASLDEIVVRRHDLLFITRLELFRHVVLGVHQMHLADVVHRDIKAENNLVFRRPKTTLVKVNDLGRSRRLPDSPRFAPLDYLNGRGDLRFAPPEALWGQIDDNHVRLHQADVYLVGSVLYELVAGQSITGLALGNGSAIASWSRSVTADTRAQDYKNRTAEIRGRYETAFQLFENETPQVIRHEAVALLRQLCDPIPTLRDLRHRTEPPGPGLNWILNRTDILIRRLRYADKQAATLAAKKRLGGTS